MLWSARVHCPHATAWPLPSAGSLEPRIVTYITTLSGCNAWYRIVRTDTHLTLLRTHTLFINVSYIVQRNTLLTNVGSATALRCVSPQHCIVTYPGRRGRNQHRAQHTPSIPPTQITQIINRARSSKPSDLKPTQLAIVKSFLTLYPSVTISLLITHIALPHGANCA